MIKRGRALELATFGLAAVAAICAFGTITTASSPDDIERERQRKELRSWTDDTDQAEPKQRFVALRHQVQNWKERWHWWHIPALLIAAAQAVMFVLAILPLFAYRGTPKFLLSCEHDVRNLKPMARSS